MNEENIEVGFGELLDAVKEKFDRETDRLAQESEEMMSDVLEMSDEIGKLIAELEQWHNDFPSEVSQEESEWLESRKSNLEHWRGKHATE